jgi:hypothetical protein
MHGERSSARAYGVLMRYHFIVPIASQAHKWISREGDIHMRQYAGMLEFGKFALYPS